MSMEIDKKSVDAILKSNGFEHYRWIDPKEVVLGQWVRFKCMFGCSSYGNVGSCPPNTPSIEECRRFFDEYSDGIIIHIPQKLDKPEDRGLWSVEINSKLLEVERSVFLAGFRKAFITYMDECRLCEDCSANREDCLHKSDSRPCPESLGVDVFETVRKYGLPIKVLTDYKEEMNRYSILLID